MVVHGISKGRFIDGIVLARTEGKKVPLLRWTWGSRLHRNVTTYYLLSIAEDSNYLIYCRQNLASLIITSYLNSKS